MIKYPDKFNKKLPANYDGLFDWDFLQTAFEGTKIMPMDIDALVERREKVLIFETKEPGKDIPEGQQIALRTLVKIGRGDIHLMVLYGKTAQTIIGMEEWYYTDSGVVKRPFKECDYRYVVDRVYKWRKWAESEFNN